jgi:nicotinamide mononucleotide transporter PnuC
MLLNFLDYSALIINVLYTIYIARLKIWSWSLGIIGAVLVLILFAIKGIHSLALLQCVFILFFGYGWYKWHTQGIEGNQNTIQWMKLKDYIRYIVYAIVLCTLFVGFNYFTNSKDIFSTGILTGITFVAVIMTIEKFIENWIVWIISDLYFVVVMYQQGLHGQVIQNFIFFLTAVYGFYYWFKNSNLSKK